MELPFIDTLTEEEKNLLMIKKRQIRKNMNSKSNEYFKNYYHENKEKIMKNKLANLVIKKAQGIISHIPVKKTIPTEKPKDSKSLEYRRWYYYNVVKKKKEISKGEK